MQKIPFMDAYYLMVESRRTPMHVAAMSFFTMPKGVNEVRFLQELGSLLKSDVPLRRPFSDKVKTGPLGVAGNMFWEADEEMDMAYHVRHSALPRPGDFKELFTLVSRLHGSLLDRSRPLWELHLIEGLKNHQFATYFKVHHSAVDGVSAMNIMKSMYADSPRKKLKLPPLSQQAYDQFKAGRATRSTSTAEQEERDVRAVFEALQGQLNTTFNVAGALGELASVWLRRNKTLSVPFHKVPRSQLTSQLSGARRMVAQSWPLERIRAVGRAVDGTINDAVLAMVAGALRKHLLEQNDLPKTTLKAMAPVSIRTESDVKSSNAVGMVVVDLGTNIKDAGERMYHVKASMDASKAQLRKMSKKEIEIYSALSHAPHLLTQVLGVASRFPAYNTIISNIPGPDKRQYWHGARLEGLYPLGIPVDGCSINFTLLSNHENLDFGIVACRQTVPHVQRLIDYLEDALTEMELAAGL